MGRPGAVTIALAALAIAIATTAAADTVTVGVFAPAVPFAGSPARVAFASRLAQHIGAELGAEAIGRVYARATDLIAAVRRGEIQLAVVDAGFLAARGDDGRDVLAVAVQGGDPAPAWQLVTAGSGQRVLDLRGRSLLVPTVGGREADLVTNAMFGAELPRSFWSRITAAPDARSAVAAVGLGKADAAIVPASVPLPAGVRRVTALPRHSGPVAIGYGLAAARRARIAAALLSFRGDDVIASFQPDDGGGVRALAGRFSPPQRRGPLMPPPRGLDRDDLEALLAGRRFRIERIDATRFALPPPL